MEWRMYSRTGRVYAAEFRESAVVRTGQGPVDAAPGDYLVVNPECTRIRHYPAAYFAEAFQALDRPVPRRSLAALSAIVVRSVTPPGAEDGIQTCLRCGRQRTLSEFEGVPTCIECELTVRAEREETVSCQHDGAAMRKEVIQNVIVDRCPECGGVWFDGGELEVLGAALERAADPRMPTALGRQLLHSLVRGAAE